jgi:hypothetical protein
MEIPIRVMSVTLALMSIVVVLSSRVTRELALVIITILLNHAAVVLQEVTPIVVMMLRFQSDINGRHEFFKDINSADQ